MEAKDIIKFRKNKGISQEDFGKMIGVSKNTVYNYESGGVIPESKKEIIERILHGMGQPSGVALNEAKISYGRKGSPYYDVDFVGGFDLLMEDKRSNPEYMIDLPPYNKPGVIWCNLYGKSMEPFIMSGDRIAIKEVSIEDVIFGKPYGVLTTGGLRTVKWIVRSPEKNCVRLVPENKDPKFGDYQDIPKKEIRKVFLVMGAIRAL